MNYMMLHVSCNFLSFLQVNTKFLAPLFLAYDDRLREKEQMIRTYDVSRFKLRYRLLIRFMMAILFSKIKENRVSLE